MAEQAAENAQVFPTHDTLKSRAGRAVSPGWGYCLRCGLPWRFVEGHTTWYTETSGCFPLCAGCWQMLGSPEARIEYYAEMIRGWEKQHPVSDDTRRAIQRAVANEGQLSTSPATTSGGDQ